MTDYCANGWTVVSPAGTKWWTLPGTDRRIQLRKGPTGLVLMHWTLWWHEEIESLLDGYLDEAGYSMRVIAGTNVYSNHAGGMAVDLNWTRHPRGEQASADFTPAQIDKVHRALEARYTVDGVPVLRWGGDWTNPDVMHTEVGPGVTPTVLDALRDALLLTARGQRLAGQV